MIVAFTINLCLNASKIGIFDKYQFIKNNL